MTVVNPAADPKVDPAADPEVDSAADPEVDPAADPAADLVADLMDSALRSALPVPPPRLWVAFSGGVDSTALLLAARRWAAPRSVALQAVHVHHGMQVAADSWLQHCATIAADLQLPLLTVRVEVAPGGSREAAARDARYRALAPLLAVDEVMLFAHHRDDQIETVLMGMLRGSGSRLMPQRRRLGAGWLLRPLLAVPRASLATYVSATGVPCVADPMNADARFSRAFLRMSLLPGIEAHWRDAGARLLAHAARDAQRERALDHLLQPLLAAAVDAAGQLSCAALRNQPADVALALLAAWLTGRGVVAPPTRHLAELLRQALQTRPDRQPDVPVRGGHVRRHRGRLVLLDRTPRAPVPASPWDGQAPLQTNVGELRPTPALAALRWPVGGVTVRPRQGGERLRIAAHGPRRAVKELLRTRGIAPWLRRGWPLLYADDELICVPDVAIADGWRTGAGELGVNVVVAGLV